MHDTIGCYLDLDKGQIKFSKNGKFYSLFLWNFVGVLVLGEGQAEECTHMQSLTEQTLFQGRTLALHLKSHPT